MNKHCYRIIFSRTHGERRVVSELARSCSTEPGQSCGTGAPRLWVTLRRATWLLAVALFAGPAMANGIVADHNATPGQRPEVIATQNGLPQVNITAPNQAGISHNQYQQFDVAQNGAILNNSAVMTSTQLAGMIQGNPNLKPNAPAARVILNEVNSNNPSQLRGYMEVAGGRAQVIVANPAGIVCNGCGTINAGRMTLTTGKPQLNADGSLAGYQVERGVVRIEGGGLNGDVRHDTEYVDVLARAVEINAGVWAKKELAVVAGRNRVSADTQRVTSLADDGSARPELAIDMGEMGGMYSGQIRMIGTEAGVGVRNQNAQVQAGKSLVVSSEGKLVWQSAAQDGVTLAGGDISLAARDSIDYQGKLHSGGQLTVQSRKGGITQSGTLAAAADVRLTAAGSIQSRGHLLAGSDASSQIVQEASLQLESQDAIRASGSLLSKKEVSASGRRLDLSGAQVAASRATLTAQEGGVAVRQAMINGTELVINTSGDIDAQQAKISVGRWQIDGRSLFSQQAGWSQTGSGESRFTLSGGLDNSDGTIESQQLSLQAVSLNNQRGRMVALDNAAQHWRVDGLLDNTTGELGSNGDLTLEAGSLNNQGGTVKTQSALAITARDAVNNRQGNLLAGNALTLSAGGDLDNHAGTLNGGRLSLTAPHLNNAQGEIISQCDDLSLTASGLDNTEGKVIALQDLSLTTTQDLNNSGGWIEAGHHLSLNSGGFWQNSGGTAQGGERVTATADQLNNASGRLQSGGDLALTSRGDILNQGGKLTAQNALAINGTSATLFDNDGGSLQSGGDLLLQGGALNNRQSGQIFSQQSLTLSLAGDWDNQGGTLTGNARTQASAANLFNTQGAINALDTLDMQFTGRLDNSNGRIFSRLSQTLQSQEIGNAQGWMGSQGRWAATTAGFDNTAGSVQSQQAELSATWLSNASGVLQSAAGLALRVAQDINNLAGKASAQQLLTVQGQTRGSRTGNINNAGGQWLAGEGLTITAAHLDNTQGGLLYSQRQLRLNLAGDLDNRAGKVQSGEALQLDAKTLNNAGGNIDSQQQLTLNLPGSLDNSGGAVRSNGGQQVDASTIDNRQGVFSSREAINLTTGQLENASGTLISQGAGLYTINLLNNQQGKVHSGAALTLVAAQLNNQGGQLVATQNLMLKATALDNSTQGVLSSQAGLSLQTDRLSNRDGGLLLGTTFTDIAARDIDNSSGRLQSAGMLLLRGVAQLDNRQGRMLANGDLTLNADLSPTDSPLVLLNQSGRLESADALTVHAQSFDNQGGTLLGLQALTLTAQQDYTRQAGETISSNGTVTFSLGGAFTNLADWLLPGNLVLNATAIINPAILVGKTVQLTTGALLNSGRLEADNLTLNVDSLDNSATVTGSAVAADRDVNLRAGRDVEIGAATETDSHYQLEEKKKSGLMSSGGIGFTVGKQSTRHEIDEKGTTQSQSVSTVGSSQGNVSVTAGNWLHVGGADLVAGMDMNLAGDSVSVDPGYDQRMRTEKTETKQSGLSIALSGTAGSALNTAVSTAQQARKSGDSRVSALQNTQAALNGVQAAQAVQMDGLNTAAADARNAAAGRSPGDKDYETGATSTVGVSASFGSQSSKSETRTESSQSQGSTLTAGRNLNVTATGKNGTAQSGDISITGSQLKAGGDLSLDASRDLLLQSAQNTQSTDSTSSSKGGSAGVGIGVGSGGYGISVSASVNAAKGSEKGNGLTHSETTLDAGSRLSLTSGRDTTLTGAQVSGESVKVDAGRNLTLTSEQDSDRYDSKQQSVSAGGSFTFGSMTGSANVNVSRDKMHSTWQSVAEQTGIFAGKGGFNVTVGEHTQLNGAVIASTATPDKNRLDTGTLGFGDIENHADYNVEHQSAGISTGGSIGGDFAGNMANGMLAGLSGGDSASSLTKSAVSEGTIVIRDKEKQTQDVADLSRDVANANPGLEVIFDKEKEQNRLKAAQLIGEIGAQAGDIARTQGQIIATKAANEKMSGSTQADRDRALAELKAKDPTKQYSESDVSKQVYSNFYNQAFVDSGLGTGGKVQRAISAVTAAVQGLSGGNVAQAVSGAASPYLATEIHKLTEGNPEAQAMAHAVLGAVTSYASGNSALTGAAGGVSGELMAKLVMNQLYPGKAVSDLTETEKQTVSALGTLAAGLAGGVAGDSTADAVAGAQAGKNAVENNLLSTTSSDKLDKAVEKIKNGDKSLQTANELIKLENADKRSDALVSKFTKDPSQMSSTERAELAGYLRVYASEMEKEYGPAVSQELVKGLLSGQDYIKRNPDSEAMSKAQSIMNTWGYHKSNASIGDAPLMFGSSVLGTTIREGMALNTAIGVGVNVGVQLAGKDPFSYVDAIMAGITSAATTGKGIVGSAAINMGGAAIGSGIKGEDPTNSALGAGFGSVAGGVAGKVASEVMKPVVKETASDVAEAAIGSLTSEVAGNKVKDQLDHHEGKK